ncbi:M20 family metallopeptidase [Candidatus Aerophobetes bacterium]|nr:M20 family metallopeptidase [Candidatus Aerophobetes bacterium]
MKNRLIEIDNNRLMQDLEEMVSIPSIVGEEEKLANFLYQRLKEIGLKPKYQPVENKRKNVYAIYHFSENGPLLTFNGHMDTVPVSNGWETEPFKPVLNNEKLYGLGACDMKGGLAALLEALRVIINSGKDLKGAIAFSGVVDEEAYSKGAKKLLSTEISNSRAIILGEPWFGDKDKPIHLGCTGKILYELIAKGKAAHGFQPEKGINAIKEMARLLTSLDDLKKRKHPQFGEGNICILKIEGGYKKYSMVVPAACRAIINRLIVPGETIQIAIEDMKNLIEKLPLKANFEVISKPPSYNPFMLTEDEPILRLFKDSYRTVLNIDPVFGYHRMITDANIFIGSAGIPTLVFGPRGGEIHSPNEYVEIETLTQAAEIYALTAIKYLS